MGWYIYPQEPGSPTGPCVGTCVHHDCAEMRADSERLCRICGQPIGYENAVYFEAVSSDGATRSIVHRGCLWEEEKRQAKD